MRALGAIDTGRLGRYMPKALDEGEKTRAMKLNFTDSWLALVEEWRRHQTPVPNVSAAIRTMVEKYAEIERRNREGRK